MNDQHYTQVYVVLWMHNYQMRCSNHFIDHYKAEQWASYKGEKFVDIVEARVQTNKMIFEDEEEAAEYAVKDFYTLNETAQLLNLPRETVSKLGKQKKLTRIKHGHYSSESVEAYKKMQDDQATGEVLKTADAAIALDLSRDAVNKLAVNGTLKRTIPGYVTRESVELYSKELATRRRLLRESR